MFRVALESSGKLQISDLTAASRKHSSGFLTSRCPNQPIRVEILIVLFFFFFKRLPEVYSQV